MLAVEVELLTDRYVATHFNDRRRAEWPPHPARLFSAMVAVWADDEIPAEREREALAWLAALGAPAVTHSAAHERTPVMHYVPVNDASVARDLAGIYGKLTEADAAHLAALTEAQGDVQAKPVRRAAENIDKQRAKVVKDSAKAAQPRAETLGTITSGLTIMPDRRGKQGRFYPCVVPDAPRFYFAWPDAEPSEEQRAVLDGLIARVSRLGHSSSFVACRLVDDPPPPTLLPEPNGADAMLRVTTSGLLARLEAAYQHHQGREPRALPARMARYAKVDSGTSARASGPRLSSRWIILARISGPVLPVHMSLVLTRAVRDALLHHAEQPVPPTISGHEPGPDGEQTAPARRPHLSVVPLPFVGGAHGDGSLLGVALSLPYPLADDDRRALLRAVERWHEDGFEVRLGRSGRLRLAVSDPADTRTTLDPHTWCRASQRWLSVTPIALDRHPGDLWSPRPDKRDRAHSEAQNTIAAACGNVGLPRPAIVELSREPLLRGTAPASRHQAFTAKNGPRRYLVHCELEFPEPVEGPILLGAGRFLGYGLFRPARERRADVRSHG